MKQELLELKFVDSDNLPDPTPLGAAFYDKKDKLVKVWSGKSWIVAGRLPGLKYPSALDELETLIEELDGTIPTDKLIRLRNIWHRLRYADDF